MKKIIFLLMITVFVLGCSKEVSVKPEANAKVPNFKLQDLEGKKYESSKLINNGKKTLFVVAAEWCPHCKSEAPEIQRFYDEYKDKVNIVVVYSNVNSSLDEVKNYIKNNEYTFPVYYDSEGEILRIFQVQAFPFNLKIDGDKVAEVYKGELDYDLMVSEFLK
ncbi:MAG: TlpA disulfide reductase family protein [Leptotrichiaceae bacterium]|nr:TlpA disulfide reductase family protein [Leptotrichiaceae bacterium]